ncbi:MAG TPA: hypothetical protein VGI98_03400 [Candidatus Limnocylindrales bacterium]
MAGNDLGELADVHLDEATPDDLLEHGAQDTARMHPARACSVPGRSGVGIHAGHVRGVHRSSSQPDLGLYTSQP